MPVGHFCKSSIADFTFLFCLAILFLLKVIKNNYRIFYLDDLEYFFEYIAIKKSF